MFAVEFNGIASIGELVVVSTIATDPRYGLSHDINANGEVLPLGINACTRVEKVCRVVPYAIKSSRKSKRAAMKRAASKRGPRAMCTS